MVPKNTLRCKESAADMMLQIFREARFIEVCQKFKKGTFDVYQALVNIECDLPIHSLREICENKWREEA